jgi:hypothetical protein
MSSPIHQPKDLDPALMYAPPWARDQAQPAPSRPAPPVEWPPQRRRLDDNRGFSGDRAVLEVKRQLTLNPEMLPEPPAVENDRPGGRIALRICGAAGLAALAAWGIVTLPGTRLFEHEAVQAKSATVPILITATNADSLPRATPMQVATRNEQQVATRTEQQVATRTEQQVATRNEQGDAAAPAPIQPGLGTNAARPAAVAAPIAAPAPPERNPLRLDDREIATLVMRGENFIANGDLASARLLLQRAADAGSANAALALAATFDPFVTNGLGVAGGEPDVVRARKWYQRAIELGSTAASKQLAKLAETPR